jgi:RimJ/RimL family protein N-acetyltransferase
MAVTFLAGEKVRLRPIERTDVDALLPWVNDPEVTRTLLIYRPMTREAEIEFIAQLAKSEQDVALGIVLKATDRLIGATGLNQVDTRSRQCQFGIFIGDKAEWGKGYGTEATRLITGFAFETLNLNRVWLHVTAENAAGIRAYEKVGYRREGVLRQALYKEGRYQDLVTMAILRDEWDAGR